MDLYPNDLGRQISGEVQQERSRSLTTPAPGMPPNTMGAVAGGSLVLTLLCGALHLVPLAVFLGTAAVICLVWYAALAVKALNFTESLKRPVQTQELQSVQFQAGDPLRRNYLELALSVVNLPDTKDETANREVRDAVTALGTALEALPPEQVIVTDNPVALRAEAQAQIEDAQGEPDAVIAASNRRRAESLLRRADTSARTLLLLRRNKALREEVGEQIKALETSLTALQIGGRQSAPELSGLAASIHRVALEANAVTVARAEVDTLLSQPRGIIDTAEPQAAQVLLEKIV